MSPTSGSVAVTVIATSGPDAPSSAVAVTVASRPPPVAVSMSDDGFAQRTVGGVGVGERPVIGPLDGGVMNDVADVDGERELHDGERQEREEGADEDELDGRRAGVVIVQRTRALPEPHRSLRTPRRG